jgi:hypothetical protein
MEPFNPLAHCMDAGRKGSIDFERPGGLWTSWTSCNCNLCAGFPIPWDSFTLTPTNELILSEERGWIMSPIQFLMVNFMGITFKTEKDKVVCTINIKYALSEEQPVVLPDVLDVRLYESNLRFVRKGHNEDNSWPDHYVLSEGIEILFRDKKGARKAIRSRSLLITSTVPAIDLTDYSKFILPASLVSYENRQFKMGRRERYPYALYIAAVQEYLRRNMAAQMSENVQGNFQGVVLDEVPTELQTAVPVASAMDRSFTADVPCQHVHYAKVPTRSVEQEIDV